MSNDNLDPLPAAVFERLDNSPDALFYQSPRFVAHIDQATIEQLTKFYGEILFPGADVLDLMSSWISHLPEEPELHRVAGLGMNDAELKANPRLTDRMVHDLNLDPNLPYTSSSFDFVFVAVSIQYLIHPLEVFKEIARVLRHEGQVVVATSHRCFPTKAIRGFHDAGLDERVRLICEYITRVGVYAPPEFLDRSPAYADPLWLVRSARV